MCVYVHLCTCVQWKMFPITSARENCIKIHPADLEISAINCIKLEIDCYKYGSYMMFRLTKNAFSKKKCIDQIFYVLPTYFACHQIQNHIFLFIPAIFKITYDVFCKKTQIAVNANSPRLQGNNMMYSYILEGFFPKRIQNHLTVDRLFAII